MNTPREVAELLREIADGLDAGRNTQVTWKIHPETSQIEIHILATAPCGEDRTKN